MPRQKVTPADRRRFGRQIEEALTLSGHSRTWLAEQLDVHPSFIGRLITGERGASPAHRRRIIELLGLAEQAGDHESMEANQEKAHLLVKTLGPTLVGSLLEIPAERAREAVAGAVALYHRVAGSPRKKSTRRKVAK